MARMDAARPALLVGDPTQQPGQLFSFVAGQGREQCISVTLAFAADRARPTGR